MHKECQASLKERSQFVDAVQPLPVSAKTDGEKEECVNEIACRSEAISRNSYENSKLFYLFGIVVCTDNS